MQEQTQRTEDSQPQPWVFLGRLFVVLAAVVVVVLLAKRANALDRQLQAVLDEETEALERGDWEAFAALQDREDPAFLRQQKSSFDSFVFARSRGEPVVAPSLYVVQVARRADEAWALVMEDPEGDPASGPATIEFFRRVYGQWLHTGPDPDHWGAPQESQSGQITWHYREADAERVARLAPFAEALAGQICDDLGLDREAGTAVVNFCYSSDCGTVVYPADEEVELPTPGLFGLDEEYLKYVLAHLLTDQLVSRAAGFERGGSLAGSRILYGIVQWEVAQVMGGDPDAVPLYSVREAAASGTLLPLEGLDALGSEDTPLVYDQAHTLVEYLVAQYGREILPALLDASSRRLSVAETLQEVLGPDLDLAAFETGWLSFIRERYGN
jgi:hypothetical protein